MRLQAFRLAALGVVASFVGIAPAESVTDSNFAETAALLHDGRFDAAERRTRPRAASSDLPAVFQDAFVYYWRLLYDENAQLLSGTFADYLLPLATDVPRVDLVHLETPSPLNPLGVKGAGEGGTIPAIAAIVSAVENALEPYGVRIAEAPITPQRIVELLGEHALGRTR